MRDRRGTRGTTRGIAKKRGAQEASYDQRSIWPYVPCWLLRCANLRCGMAIAYGYRRVSSMAYALRISHGSAVL